MRWLFLALIVLHGLIHFLGFTKAFGIHDPPQLTQTISKPWGLAWLAAGTAMLITALFFALSWRDWWAVGFGAVALSQVVIFSSWTDAKLGTIANALVLAGMLYDFVSEGPFSFRAHYDRAARPRLAPSVTRPRVTDSDYVNKTHETKETVATIQGWKRGQTNNGPLIAILHSTLAVSRDALSSDVLLRGGWGRAPDTWR
jgi:hypothetical protein